MNDLYFFLILFCCTDNQGRIYLMSVCDHQIMFEMSSPIEICNISNLQLSQDGEILVAESLNGIVHGFSLKRRCLHCVFGSFVAHLSSYREVTIQHIEEGTTSLKIDVDPEILQMGPSHIAVGYDRKVSLYHWKGSSPTRRLDLVQLRQVVMVNLLLAPILMQMELPGSHIYDLSYAHDHIAGYMPQW